MSAREQIEQMKKSKNAAMAYGATTPTPSRPSTPVPTGSTGKKSSGFKIMTFDKLAEVFSNLVNKNALDNVFVEGEIKVFVKFNEQDSLLDMLSYQENRPMDVLLYEAKRVEGNQEDLKFFDVVVDSSMTPDSQVYLWNMKAFCFAYLLVMTRGNLPSQSGNSAGNKLPNLLTSRLLMDAASIEKDFAGRLSNLDLSKITCDWMLDIDISTMPDPIRNRIAKGTAGSRALKIIAAAIQLVPIQETQSHPATVGQFAALVDVTNAGSAYLSMHPMKQHVQSQIENFYRSCLLLAFEHVGVNHFEDLKNNLNKIDSFKKDAALQDLVVVGNGFKFGSGSYLNGFIGKSPDQVIKLFGKSLI